MLRALDVFAGTADLITHADVIDAPSDAVRASAVLAALKGRGSAGLWLLACLAGNDYSKFKDISLGFAKRIVSKMPPGSASAVDAVAAAEVLHLSLPADAAATLGSAG